MKNVLHVQRHGKTQLAEAMSNNEKIKLVPLGSFVGVTPL